MIIPFSILLIALLIFSVSNQCLPFGRRVQYDPSLTSDQSTDKFIIAFNTQQLCAGSYVAILYKTKLEYFSCETKHIATSVNMSFYNAYVHRCVIQEVDYDENLYYRTIGLDSQNGKINRLESNQWVQITITDPRKEEDKHILVFADWGIIQNQKMETINDHVLRLMGQTKIDLLMINGDVAYDLDSDKGNRYIGFLQMMDNVTSRLPVVFLPGNHQHFTNDTIQLFNSTFQAYNIYDKLSTGFKFGRFYIILFDPYKKVYSIPQPISSLQALTTQLKKGRLTNKFIVPFSHYPLTCSSEWFYCQQRLNRTYSYFDTMLAEGVSLYIGAHTHSYQRNYPYYGNQTFQIQQSPYQHDKNYLISIIEGVAGNNISITQTMEQVQNYTAQYTVNETGFGMLRSTANYVKYEHYSTKRGFMDEMIINLNDSGLELVTY